MISKRNTVRVISFCCAFICAMAGFSYYSYQRAEHYLLQVEAGSRRALGDLSSYMNSISAELEKGCYAGTPAQLSAISARIWRDASAAKASYASLSMDNSQLTDAYRFLSQSGDYAMAVSRKAANGQELTEEEWDSMAALRDTARELNNQIAILESEVASGERRISSLTGTFYSESRQPAGQGRTVAVAGSLDGGAQDMENGGGAYPTLIYDGPFSDHISERKPRMLEGEREISRDDARKTAAHYAGIGEDQLNDDTDEDSSMPSYVFYGGDKTVAVTKQGGFVTYLLDSRAGGEHILSADQAVKKAGRYLRSMGIRSMEKTYYETAEGVCTINFAYETEGVICYTDLIKVGVALDSGEVVFYDARNYIANHRERNLPKPVISEEEAVKSVSPRLKLEKSSLALIPTPGLGEVFCYEFMGGTDDGRRLLVYVNAETGAEENILLLIESDNGVLTI